VRGFDQGFGHLHLAPRIEPVAVRRDGDGRRGLAVRTSDPGRERLGSRHQADVAQFVAPAPGPLSALRHLVGLLASDALNPPLAAGEIVSTGTLTKAMPVTSGETWSAAPAGIALGEIRVRSG